MTHWLTQREQVAKLEAENKRLRELAEQPVAPHRWTDQHGPDELYDKFVVVQRSTGKTLGEDGELIFVLRPERDREAWSALMTYCSCVEHRSPGLAGQLSERLDAILAEQSKA